jgi:hypothetical protein
LGDNEADRLVLPGINAYNAGEYESALEQFAETVHEHPEMAEEIQPHLRICKRVVGSTPTSEDIEHCNSVKKWDRLPRILRFFRTKPLFKMRCKYCGHYISYLPPNYGLAYLGSSNCELCGRGYPAPDFVWDGVDGQAYIYYRNSVTEDDFYEEFEEQYDVSPDRTYFMKK